MSCKLYNDSYSGSNQGGVQSNSKKIKKSSFNTFSSVSSSSSSTKKKYLTKGRDEKLLILADVESALRKELKSTYSEFDLAEMNLADLIQKTQTDEYNRLIQEVLINHGVSFTPCKKEFQLWRKKIKNWITMPEKDDERRGGVLVPKQIKPQLLNVLHEILDDMPCRDFERLQEELLPALEDMRQSAGLKIPKNMCSDHWWFRFIRKHPDLKAKWDSKPCPGRKNGGATPYSVRPRSSRRTFEDEEIMMTPLSEPLNHEENPLEDLNSMKNPSLKTEEVDEAALSHSTEIESDKFSCKDEDLFGELPDDVFLYEDIDLFEHHKEMSNQEQDTEIKPSSAFLNDNTDNQDDYFNLNTEDYSRISNNLNNNDNSLQHPVDNYFSFQSNSDDFKSPPFGSSEPNLTNLLSPFAQPFWCQSPNIKEFDDSWMNDDDFKI